LVHADKSVLDLQHEVDRGSKLGLAVSNLQEWAVICSTRRVFFMRVLMYPNLYPAWPYLHYGDSAFENNPNVTEVQCTMSDDGYTILWLGRIHSGGLQIRLFLHTTAGRKIPTSDSRYEPDLSGWATTHERDRYPDAWGPIPISDASDSSDNLTDSILTAAAISGDGLVFASLRCSATRSGEEKHSLLAIRRVRRRADPHPAAPETEMHRLDPRHCNSAATVEFVRGSILVTGGAASTAIDPMAGADGAASWRPRRTESITHPLFPALHWAPSPAAVRACDSGMPLARGGPACPAQAAAPRRALRFDFEDLLATTAAAAAADAAATAGGGGGLVHVRLVTLSPAAAGPAPVLVTVPLLPAVQAGGDVVGPAAGRVLAAVSADGRTAVIGRRGASRLAVLRWRDGEASAAAGGSALGGFVADGYVGRLEGGGDGGGGVSGVAVMSMAQVDRS
jgi:hypothetical protein